MSGYDRGYNDGLDHAVLHLRKKADDHRDNKGGLHDAMADRLEREANAILSLKKGE